MGLLSSPRFIHPENPKAVPTSAARYCPHQRYIQARGWPSVSLILLTKLVLLIVPASGDERPTPALRVRADLPAEPPLARFRLVDGSEFSGRLLELGPAIARVQWLDTERRFDVAWLVAVHFDRDAISSSSIEFGTNAPWRDTSQHLVLFADGQEIYARRLLTRDGDFQTDTQRLPAARWSK